MKMQSKTSPNETICPITKRSIDELDCGDMVLFSLDMLPERFVLEELRAVPNFKAICRNCDNNPYKEELADEQHEISDNY